MSQSRVNLEVFCKRDGTRGIVVGENKDVIVIQTSGINKTITESTFKRWYTIVPQDKPEDAPSAPAPNAEDLNFEQNYNENESALSGKSKSIIPSGEAGVGLELRAKFISMVKTSANQSLDFTYDEKNCRDIIKYNGKNVFECTTARRRFNVLCHHKALTSYNLKRANKIYPKDWEWPLNVKFVFTDLSQTPLMRSVITDSLYYRQEENRD